VLLSAARLQVPSSTWKLSVSPIPLFASIASTIFFSVFLPFRLFCFAERTLLSPDQWCDPPYLLRFFPRFFFFRSLTVVRDPVSPLLFPSPLALACIFFQPLIFFFLPCVLVLYFPCPLCASFLTNWIPWLLTAFFIPGACPLFYTMEEALIFACTCMHKPPLCLSVVVVGLTSFAYLFLSPLCFSLALLTFFGPT